MLRRFAKYLLESAGHIVIDRPCYREDGLITIHNDSFQFDKGFQEAYARGIVSCAGHDPSFRWRAHVALWAGATAMRLPGDFVECGVNGGFMSSAIMYHVEWNLHKKRFFLIDTFAGPVLSQFSEDEIKRGRQKKVADAFASGAYLTNLEQIRNNFSGWRNVHLFPGQIPEILPEVPVQEVAFLHIDLNCAYPERTALEFFWPRLTQGAIVLLDDYACTTLECQKQAMDEAALELGTHILSLPTGQGLILKVNG